MNRVLMPASVLAAMKKVAFAIFCMTLLMLFVAPAWADVCGDAFPTDELSCGVTITINGTPRSFRTITPAESNQYYDGSDDVLVGITNNSSVNIGAIILSGTGPGGPIFAFDADGACAILSSPPAGCPFGPTGYEGPNNTFKLNGDDVTTGKVVFKTPLAAGGGTTWFSLEGIPTGWVAIGEGKVLTGSATSIYKFGPGNPTLVNPGPLAPGSEDDFKITPQKTATDDPTGDIMTVTPVPVDPASFSAGPNFPATLACIPYFDYSSNSDGSNKAATCIELELDCSGADSCNFAYTTQLDYGIYGPGLFNNTNTLIGGPHLLLQHDVPCPTKAFTDDIVTQYTGATVGPAASPDPPPIRGGSQPAHTCLVSAYDTNSSVPLIAQGVTVSTFDGFELLSKMKATPIARPLPVPLIWDFNDSSGNPITTLTLCPNTSCPERRC